jgi:chromosome segregation and condensation protein ScpB
MGRPNKSAFHDAFDPVLMDLPEAARWREWMGRVEAVIFAARSPVPREALAMLVGSICNLDDLIADIRDELHARPYELVFVAGSYQLRTKPRFAPAIRAASGGDLRVAGAPELTPTEMLAVTAIAYLQPATRAKVSRLAGKEVSRDVIGALKRHLIDGALRAPEPGAPFAYVTTGNSWRCLGLRRCATFPTSRGSRTRGFCKSLGSTSILTALWGLVTATATRGLSVVE